MAGNNAYKMECLNHHIGFEISIPNAQYQWDNEKCILFDNKLSIDWEREPNQFFFRAKINGKLTLIGELAKAVVEMNKDVYATVTLRETLLQPEDYPQIQTMNKTLGFRFSKSACVIKNVIPKYTPGGEGESWTTNYIVEVTPEPVDKYTDILNNIDNEFDIIKLTVPRRSISYFRRPCLQLYIANTDYLGHFLGGNYWETEVSDTQSILASNKRFAEIFRFRCIRVVSHIPHTSGTVPDGIYYVDLTNAQIDYPDQLTPPCRYDYYIYENGDISTGRALHLYLWGGQSNQTLEINYSMNRGTVANPDWVDKLTLVAGSQAPDGYDYFSDGGDPYTVTSGRTLNYIPSNVNVDIVELTERIYYARWYLPKNSFGNRVVYEKPADDPTVGGDIIGYKYLSPAIASDVSVITGIQNSTPGPWGKNDYGEYFHPPVDGNSYAPLLISSWDYVSFWILRSSFSSQVEAQGRETITIKDAYSIVDVLEYLFEAARTNGTSVYPMYRIEHNYQGTPLDTVYVTPKSNIVRGPYSLAAQKAPTTLGEYLGLLRNIFNVYWYINGQGKIIMGTRETMMTSDTGAYLADPDGSKNPRNGRSWGYGSQELQFDTSELPERQQFKWMDPSTDVFNYPILINQGALVKPDETDEVSLNSFTADLDYMVISGSECSLDGFAVLVTGVNETVDIGIVTYLDANYSVSNPGLSIVKLTDTMADGLKQERPTEKYKWLYGETSTQFTGTLAYSATQQLKKPIPLLDGQNLSQSILDLEDWAYKIIATNFGHGRVRKMSVNMLSRIATLTIEQRPQ